MNQRNGSFVISICWLLALVAFCSYANADAPPSMPDCATRCLVETLPLSSCQPTNQTCICNDQAFAGELTGCIEANCTVRQTLIAINITQTECHRPVRDRSEQYQNINNAFAIVSAIFLIQRFGYKVYAGMDIMIDDWLTLLIVLVGTPSTIINARFVTVNGLGRDIWTLTPDQITRFSMFFYIQEIIYFVEVSLAKLTLLCFYIRIFPSTRVRHLLLGTVVFNCLFGVAFGLVAVFQCTPISYFWVMWDKEHTGGKCIDINAMSWANAAISILLDVWMLAIPLSQLRNLQLGWKKKVGVALMFSVGLFVTIVSILRLKSVIKFSYSTNNATWDFTDVGIWSDIEINVSIICLCLPSLRLLMVRLFPRLRESTHRYHEHRTNAVTPDIRNPSLSRREGDPTNIHVGGELPQAKCNKTKYLKAFSVKYLENDQVQLVSLRDQDKESTRSGRSR